MGKMITS